MAEYEYEEENLDEFMINASSILAEEDNPEKETIIESLKHHLSSISGNQTEIKNFYNTLNIVLFNKNSKKINHKQAFKLYPIIFSFNPNSSFNYIDFFLFSMNKSISEENHSDFAFLSIIFSEVVLSFYSDEKTNKNLVNQKYLLDNNKKYKLYEKLLNFCNEKIKTNKKLEQSFGCLLLTEFIEKCPIVKEQKYLDSLFKIISNYLDDRFFECKLDLLNCTISLIFTAESKFKPYANICLFKVLDYLTDDEWMKRKLAINIVYTLVFYCKDEIMGVKENIVEFLNTLKEDPVEEVREVCIQTLKIIEDNETKEKEEKEKEINTAEINNENQNEIENQNDNKDENENKNEIENEKENENQINDNDDKNINENININNKNENLEENINNDKNNNINNNINDNINKNVELNQKEKKVLNKKENKNKTGVNNNKSKNYANKVKSKKEIDNKKNEENIINDKLEIKNENNTKSMTNFKINKNQNRLMMKKKANEEYLKKQLLKEKLYLEKKEKELNEKAKSYANISLNNQNQNQPKSYKPKKRKEAKTISKLIKEFSIPNTSNKNKDLKNENENSNNSPTKDDNNITNQNNLKNENEQFQSTLNEIFKQLNAIQKDQNQFFSMLNNLQNNINENYSNLNERILALENHYLVDEEN